MRMTRRPLKKMSEGSKQRMIRAAAYVIGEADAVLFTTGAGMGVDSGLPDFRSDNGFWKAYPPLEKLNFNFVDVANPRLFQADPHLAWAFYGHRFNLYNKTQPHEGYRVQKRISEMRDSFVYTTNVDGAYVAAGFHPDAVAEPHGSIWHWQGLDRDSEIFEADRSQTIPVTDDFRALDPLPCTPQGTLARPNILMFGDWGFNGARSDLQREKLQRWIRARMGQKLVVIECGAGCAIPTARSFGQFQHQGNGGWRKTTLIRINPVEYQDADIPIAMGAKDALLAIEQQLETRGFFDR